jgi:hypothetical protein
MDAGSLLYRVRVHGGGRVSKVKSWLLALLLAALCIFLGALYDIKYGIVDWAPWWDGWK